MSLDIQSVAVLADNYAWLVKTSDGVCAVVDPGDSRPVEDALKDEQLDLILLTHHHMDHTGGVARLRQRYGARVYGSALARDRLPPLDRELRDGDVFSFGGVDVHALLTPGHAIGHLSFFLPQVPALFSGDVLFSGGCGRLLEGRPQELFDSLRRYDLLPDETLLCAGHEYTKANMAFALTVDPENPALRTRAAAVERLRRDAQPTLPVTLGIERATNPFLRARDVEIFARLRREKDAF